MFAVLQKLHQAGLLTLPGVCRIMEAVATTGINMMSILRGAARLFPRRIAITDDHGTITYFELWQQSETLATVLHADYGIRPRQKVMLACRNHAAAVKAIFAFNRLGAHLYFVDPEVRRDRLRNLEERLRFDFHVYDEPLAPAFAESPLREKSLPAYHPTDPSIDRIARQRRPKGTRLKRVLGGDIVLMSGGTTGVPKTASRKPSLFDFLPPFAALLTKLDLGDCRSFYIPPPIHHSYGLSAVVIGVLLGAEMHFTERFDAARACERIARHRIDAMATIPVMLQRVLRHDADALTSLRRIVCGSDTLTPALAAQTFERLGPILFNLYGTAEGGMISMAGPAELQNKPGTVGRPIRGVRFRLQDASGSEVATGAVGRVCVRSSWTMNKKAWIETGDLAYRDADGYLFLCGRVDDMIVSGGENVYPVDLENVLTRHPDVAAAAVVGIPDAEFGRRLKAVVVLRGGCTVEKESLIEWLRPRVARHQMPAAIEFRDDLPYTSVGKPDKKLLCE